MARGDYSATPLSRKLGAKPGVEVLVLFTTRRGELERRFAALKETLEPADALWVAWPKKASGVPTDVTEDSIREVALPLGLVDNKVCAVSDVWSGLRLVWRKERR